ncbi:hypothetical protein GQ473_01710, partial [archaeon]|nr:hypothetical protein [archaeon]
YIVIIPGDADANVISRKIKADIFAQLNKAEQDILRKVNVDVIRKMIPFSKADILDKRMMRR